MHMTCRCKDMPVYYYELCCRKYTKRISYLSKWFMQWLGAAKQDAWTRTNVKPNLIRRMSSLDRYLLIPNKKSISVILIIQMMIYHHIERYTIIPVPHFVNMLRNISM